MADNVKALSACPVLGFEWNRCHFEVKDEDYSDRNILKLLACVPIVNFCCGPVMIKWGVELLSLSSQEAKEEWGVDYQKTKAAAMIARGVATLFFAGVFFVVADAVTLASRAAFRKERAAEGQ